jgi:uroporphyrinogen-III synthase
MKYSEELKFGLVVILLIASIAVQCFHPLTADQRAKIFYDCRLAEISPDIPQKVKEECRKLMQK